MGRGINHEENQHVDIPTTMVESSGVVPIVKMRRREFLLKVRIHLMVIEDPSRRFCAVGKREMGTSIRMEDDRSVSSGKTIGE